jgi:3-oxoacyl-[acyl-carrier protein] reductase
MGKLDGRVAIVTGGSKGIGREIALEFAREGANVAICGRTAGPLEQVRDQIVEMGRKAKAIVADMGDTATIRRMIDEVVSDFGRIDILVNNAAVLLVPDSILDITEQEWDHVVNTNLRGVFFCSQLAVREMLKRHYGKIINISSIGGRGGGSLKHAHYVAAKAGVDLLTKGFAQEFGSQGIITNSIAPGFVPAGQPTQFEQTADEKREMLAHFARVAAVGRVGVPEDFSKVAVFLASEDSSFICGQVIPVDGGRMNRM